MAPLDDAAMFDAGLEALWEAGKTMLMGYAKDSSEPMPPTPDWSELPLTIKAVFGLHAVDTAVALMTLVERVCVVKAQSEQPGA